MAVMEWNVHLITKSRLILIQRFIMVTFIVISITEMVTRWQERAIMACRESGGWITPFCLHETNSDIMFAGFKNIWVA